MSVLSPALLGAVALVLLASAVSHLRAPAALQRGLGAHGVLPPGTHRPVSLVLGPVEAVLGLAALGAALTGPATGTVLLMTAPAAALLLALTVYLGRVLRTTAGRVVPCACGLGEAPVSGSTLARAGVLTAMAVTGGVTATGWSVPAAPAAEVLVTGAAALVLALSTALLPAARAVPEATVRTSHHSTPRST